MERYAPARIGGRPVSAVSTADVLEVLRPIWHVKAETARAVRQRIRSVLEWAIAMDLRNDNPCNRVVPVLGPQNDIVTHRQALPHKDVVAAIETGAGLEVGATRSTSTSRRAAGPPEPASSRRSRANGCLPGELRTAPSGKPQEFRKRLVIQHVAILLLLVVPT